MLDYRALVWPQAQQMCIVQKTGVAMGIMAILTRMICIWCRTLFLSKVFFSVHVHLKDPSVHCHSDFRLQRRDAPWRWTEHESHATNMPRCRMRDDATDRDGGDPIYSLSSFPVCFYAGVC